MGFLGGAQCCQGGGAQNLFFPQNLPPPPNKCSRPWYQYGTNKETYQYKIIIRLASNKVQEIKKNRIRIKYLGEIQPWMEMF